MKKSLVLLMAVVFTLAIASATVAADLSYWAGGDMYFYFDSNEHGLIESNGTFIVDGGLPQIKVTNGNTWAQAWLNQDKWRTPTAEWRFAFGWTKIGDVLDLGFSTKDTGTANIGQTAIGDSFNTFHADPIFNTYDNPYAVNAVLSLGNLAIKAEYNVAPETGNYGGNSADQSVYAGNFAIAFVGKLDSGEVHFGYKKVNGVDDPYLAMIGGAFAVGDASVKVDLWKDQGQMVHGWGTAGTVGTYANDGYGDIGVADGGVGAQIAVGFGNANVALFFMNPENDALESEIAVQFGYKLDKLLLEAKYFKSIDGDNTNAWIVDGVYNVGAFDVKFGVMNTGNEFNTTPAVEDETSFILGFHAALW